MNSTKPSDLSTMVAQWDSQPSKWLNVVRHVDAKYGGISSVVPALSNAVHSIGRQDVSIVAFCPDSERLADHSATLRVHFMPHYARPVAGNAFRSLAETSAGLHIHGLWDQSTNIASRTARKTNKPYLVSAHGMLQPWALKTKRWKKAIYGSIIERHNLQRADCLHALTAAEVSDYRNYGLNSPIAVIPNGVTIPCSVDKGRFLNQFPALQGKRIILFLGRIHVKKGLDILCQAWHTIAPKWPDAHLVIAGPDCEGTRKSLEAMIQEWGLQGRTSFTAMLDSGLKWSAYKAAECFILPSYSEGLSVSVLEAMGSGLPVIITKECNLTEVEEEKCGWVIQATRPAVEMALKECLESSFSKRQQMGARGRQLTMSEYSWQKVGEKMSSLYSWLEGGPFPKNVDIFIGGKS